MRKNPTTTTIAEVANVSRATVYAVLNIRKETNIRIKEETRKRVLKVAEKLGYVHNKIASSLKSGKYYSVAVLAQNIADSQFSRFFCSFDRQAGSHGYFTFLCGSDYDFTCEANKLNSILQQGVDALVVGLLHHERNTEILDKFHMRKIPVIILGNEAGKDTQSDVIGFEERCGAGQIADYIHASGHMKVAYLQLLGNEENSGSYYDARGLYLSEALQEESNNIDFKRIGTSFAMGPETGAFFMEKLLLSYGNELPTILVCCNDTLAVEMISVLRNNGYAVPEDISIMGYDNLNKTNNMMVPVTSLDLPYERLGVQCWQRLEELFSLQEQGTSSCPKHIEIKPELIIRSSSRKITSKTKNKKRISK